MSKRKDNCIRKAEHMIIWTKGKQYRIKYKVTWLFIIKVAKCVCKVHKIITTTCISFYHLFLEISRMQFWRWFSGAITTGCPKKKIGILSSFEFLYLGGVFLGVKNNSKNFGNKKYIRFFSKIFSKWILFPSISSNFLEF